jgi:hypothetical protein
VNASFLSSRLKLLNLVKKRKSIYPPFGCVVQFIFGWERVEFAMSILSGIFSRLLCRPSALRSLGLDTIPFLSARKGNRGPSLISRRRLMVGKKLYVGNLTYKVTSSDLEQLFSQFGTVQSAQVITDRDTGRSKGFGFVEMDTEAEAQEAIRGLHDQDHNGRRLTVNEARPREPRAGGGGGYGGGGGGYGGGGRDRY